MLLASGAQIIAPEGVAPSLRLLRPASLQAQDLPEAPAVTESRIHGQVVEVRPPHAPVPGALVRVFPGSETLTDAEGRFSIEIPEADRVGGTVRVRVAISGFGLAEVEEEVTLPLAAPLRLEVERLFRLDALVATASPTGSSANYQPVQALSPEDIRRRMAASVGSMLDGEPGIAMRSLGAAPTRPVIRGFDGDRVLVLENGERMGDLAESAADHAVAVDPLALRRVEVVRGPASLLYGSSALGGVVNLLTADLPEQWAQGWEGSLHTHASSMNRSAAAGGEFLYGTDAWAGTGRFSLREAGDIRTPEARLPGTSLSSRDAQLGVVHEGGALRLGLSGSFVDRGYGIPEAIDDPTEEVYLTMERQALQGRMDWTPSASSWVEGVQLRAHMARFHQQELERELVPGGAILKEDVGLEFHQRAGSATATLRHAARGPLDVGALGVAVRFRTLDVGGEEAFTPGVTERSMALFTFQELPLSPALRLQLGARGEFHHSRARPNEDFPDARDRRRSTSLSGSAGVNWRPAAGWELGTQVARAHRTPSAEELYADGPHLGAGAYEIGSAELADEVGHGLDLFVRRGWTRGGVEVAVFRNRISGFVAFQPTGETDPRSGLPVFRYEGTAARFVGGEVVAEFQPSEALALGVGVDWVRADRLGEQATPLPAIPPFRARLSIRWEVARWWVGGTLRAVARQERVAPEEEATGGYNLVDGGVGFRVGPDGRHSVTLRVDNAANRRYRDHLSRVEERGFPMPARNLSLVYRWSY